MRTIIKNTLQPIVDLLNQNNSDSRQLWSILTALRGPDNSNHALKEATTERIRFAIGIKPQANQPVAVLDPKTGELSGPSGMLISSNPLPSAKGYSGGDWLQSDAFDAAKLGGVHFAHHFENAVEAIEAEDWEFVDYSPVKIDDLNK